MQFDKNSRELKMKLTLVPLLFFILSGCDGGGGKKDAGGDEDGGEVSVLYETCPDQQCIEPPLCRAGEVLTCCTCVRIPSENGRRSSCDDMSEYCGDGDVDISCLMPDGYPEVEEVKYVTVIGVVDVYATGGNSDNIVVEIYREGEDGQVGELLGSYTSTDDCASHEAQFPEIHEVGDEAQFCPGPCQELLPDTEDCRKLAYYEIENIPTNTALIVKTSGNPGLWKDMYSYNIWFSNEQIIDGRIFYKARCLSLDDWRNIPATAGDVGGIAPGKSAVAGEIHDCGDVRIYYAMAGTNPRATTFTYFNGVEEKLYPDLSRAGVGTNLDSLYAAIEVEADRAIWITALAMIEGVGIVNLGWYRARTFPNSLTAVTLRGTRPNQVP